MGFVEKQTVYSLEFEDDYAGLVVKVTVPSMGKSLDLQRAFGELASLVGIDEAALTADDIALAVGGERDLIEAFLEHLVGWNVEDAAGASIPATREGLGRVSSMLGKHVIKTWWEFVSGDVSGPKDKPSSSGKRSLEGSLPMEPLSPSRAS